MIDRLTFWFGADAEPVWRKHLDDLHAEAERLRHPQEANDE